MDFKDLSPEQQEKINACKTLDELTDLIQESGEDLTDEELADVLLARRPLSRPASRVLNLPNCTLSGGPRAIWEV